MKALSSELLRDIAHIQNIPIIPLILEVVCRSTGMGFAAVARVTEDKWIACSVRDEIAFGLTPGGELPLETTICHEIRQSGQGVIIDQVSADAHFCTHRTPLQYGFQSYISIPIILPDGQFFGTLCAIDPAPALLNNTKTIGMFTAFTELIAFHVAQQRLLEQQTRALAETVQELGESRDENRQYRHISNHNLQEPLRKLRMFSSMLTDPITPPDAAKTQALAARINDSARRISMMIRDLSDFSGTPAQHNFEQVDLQQVIRIVSSQLGVTVQAGPIPPIKAVREQMEQLFFQLLDNAVKFAKPGVVPEVHITTMTDANEMAIIVDDNGIGIAPSQLEKIFDLFSRLSTDLPMDSFGMGLAFCRKIVRQHGGRIEAESRDDGARIRIVFPTA
ncbi:GAF domain-containing sensor histidine kinase [Chitinophaga horti]|uniref:histidine kinase n=1 Tax=Chitinophaga horti TaxID=2920382 RepID=A0ABY6J929_9BACT|nr:GAF domain-containing sensor histidine kinase [Chitinophaga horti]UYQ94799.1 GAF domain-containing sensor histidine kinase [Chitinophaga horti]